jgi:hypothetical protein
MAVGVKLITFAKNPGNQKAMIRVKAGLNKSGASGAS